MASKIKVGINGFGRIGRLTFRASLHPSSQVQVVAINDPFTSPADMARLLKFDSVHGRLPNAVSHDSGSSQPSLTVEGVGKVVVHSSKSPSEIPWSASSLGAANQPEVVVDCTGVFLSYGTASGHLKSESVRKVVVSAPPKNAPGEKEIRVFCVGVNTAEYAGEDVVSNASCTTNCLAPLAKVLDDRFGVSCGIMSTVHAVTITQPTVDANAKKNKRIGMSAMANIVPSSTGAAKAVGKVISSLAGKLTGMAFRVPVIDGSIVDMTVVLKDKAAGLKEVNQAMRKAAAGELKGILKVDDSGSFVSSMVIGERHSCVYDEELSIEMEGEKGDKMIKLVAFYDNEYGYSSRMVDLVEIVSGKAIRK